MIPQARARLVGRRYDP